MNSQTDVGVRKLVAEREGQTWCLFLDRDGVLNRRVVGDYVRSRQQFEWMDNALPALNLLNDWAPHLVVVTNQQGVGKGFMTSADVDQIHRLIQVSSGKRGSRQLVETFQVCTHLEAENCSCRKPRAGLVLNWLKHHPDSVPSLSIVVGDSWRDLGLARNVAAEVGGCGTIYIGAADPDIRADATFGSLWDFAIAVKCAIDGRDL